MGNEKHLRHAMSRYLIFRITLQTNEKVEGKKEIFFFFLHWVWLKDWNTRFCSCKNEILTKKKNLLQNFFCQIKSSTYIKANMKSLKFDQILPGVLPLCLSIDYATCFYNFQPLHCQNGNQFRFWINVRG